MFKKTFFTILRGSTSPPGVNPVDGLPPVLNFAAGQCPDCRWEGSAVGGRQAGGAA